MDRRVKPGDDGTAEKVDAGPMADVSMRTTDGIARPFFIPTRIAYRLVMALRREHLHPAGEIDGTPVA
jgi:hypothetical protein